MAGINRRMALALGGGGLAAALVGLRVQRAEAASGEVERLVAEFAGGAEPRQERIRLALPDVADNGNAVAVSVEVDSAMEGDDRVERIAIFSGGNPNPEVVEFAFTEMSGAAAVSTRMRMAQSQDVVAVARMADGQVFVDRRFVEVTVGGCTG